MLEKAKVMKTTTSETVRPVEQLYFSPSDGASVPRLAGADEGSGSAGRGWQGRTEQEQDSRWTGFATKQVCRRAQKASAQLL